MFENDSKEATNRPRWLYFTIRNIINCISVVPRNPIDFPLLLISLRRDVIRDEIFCREHH